MADFIVFLLRRYACYQQKTNGQLREYLLTGQILGVRPCSALRDFQTRQCSIFSEGILALTRSRPAVVYGAYLSSIYNQQCSIHV